MKASGARKAVAEFRVPWPVRMKAAAGYLFVAACVAGAGVWLCCPHFISRPLGSVRQVTVPADFQNMDEITVSAQARRIGPAAVSEVIDLVAGNIVEENIASYLAGGWRVRKALAGEIVTEAVNAGYRHGIDPLLIISVAAIESSFNVDARNSSGAEGLMQVHMPVHAGKFEGKFLTGYGENIEVGTAILRDYLEKTGTVAGALRFYVGAGNMKGDGGYGRKVLAERSRLALAAEGSVDAAVSLLRKGRGVPGYEKGLAATSAPFEDFLRSCRRTVLGTSGDGLAVEADGGGNPSS